MGRKGTLGTKHDCCKHIWVPSHRLSREVSLTPTWTVRLAPWNLAPWKLWIPGVSSSCAILAHAAETLAFLVNVACLAQDQSCRRWLLVARSWSVNGTSHGRDLCQVHIHS